MEQSQTCDGKLYSFIHAARLKEKYEDFERILDNHELYIQAIKTKDRDLMLKSLHQNFDDVQGKVEDLWLSQQMLAKGAEQQND